MIIKPHSHTWIDPEQPPIQRAPISPIIGPGPRQMHPGKTYKCRECEMELHIFKGDTRMKYRRGDKVAYDLNGTLIPAIVLNVTQKRAVIKDDKYGMRRIVSFKTIQPIKPSLTELEFNQLILDGAKMRIRDLIQEFILIQDNQLRLEVFEYLVGSVNQAISED